MKVEIENLSFKTIIGILDFERKKTQRVIINISFEYDYKKGKFIDYAKIAKTIKKTIKKEKFGLIEDAIVFLEKKLNKNYDIKNLKIKITKPNILKDCKVSVCK